MGAKYLCRQHLESKDYKKLNNSQKILLHTLLILQDNSGYIPHKDDALFYFADLHIEDFNPALQYLLTHSITTITDKTEVTQKLVMMEYGYKFIMTTKKKKDYKVPKWRENTEEGYKSYLAEAERAFTEIQKDIEWLKNIKEWYPHILIGESLIRSYKQFWGTKAGWYNKKKKRGDVINWKKTITNTLKYSFVYRDKNSYDYEQDYIIRMSKEKCSLTH